MSRSLRPRVPSKVDPSRPSPSQSLVSGLAVEESEFLESLWGTVDVLDQFLRVFAECSPKAGQGIPLGGHLALKTPVKQGVALGVPVEKFDELLREYGVGWYAKLAAEGCQGSLRLSISRFIPYLGILAGPKSKLEPVRTKWPVYRRPKRSKRDWETGARGKTLKQDISSTSTSLAESETSENWSSINETVRGLYGVLELEVEVENKNIKTGRWSNADYSTMAMRKTKVQTPRQDESDEEEAPIANRRGLNTIVAGQMHIYNHLQRSLKDPVQSPSTRQYLGAGVWDFEPTGWCVLLVSLDAAGGLEVLLQVGVLAQLAHIFTLHHQLLENLARGEFL
ncbi:uncharacterized protein N7482_001150 [Penicillium canariense]|uniref:Uncharacterized protein n=1 Tax=Penicillium canariense TaxID=189055 RepID=A0A9W9IEK3_9EURO|nr:uncharacterized protein N7482_001150 [Penicillium canariense]KAJ5175273.1 hypothetical protein N7482_001150 [Penicillium canariense]